MKKGTNEPTLSDVLERIDKGFNDLTDFFKSAGVKDAEPAKPEWEDLELNLTLNKEQAIELWHRLNVDLNDIPFSHTNLLPAPKKDNTLSIWYKIDSHLVKLEVRK